MDNRDLKYKVAVATSDGIVVNQHFGRASEFWVYGIGTDNTINYLEKRITAPLCHGGNHDDAELKASVERLSDCGYVLVSRIGIGASQALESRGVSPMELPGMIEESINKLIVYEEIKNIITEI